MGREESCSEEVLFVSAREETHEGAVCVDEDHSFSYLCIYYQREVLLRAVDTFLVCSLKCHKRTGVKILKKTENKLMGSV